MKMEGFGSPWRSPRLVIPAHAGIQVRFAELTWIPAFAGMTEPRRASSFSSSNGYFRRRHEGHEGRILAQRHKAAKVNHLWGFGTTLLFTTWRSFGSAQDRLRREKIQVSCHPGGADRRKICQAATTFKHSNTTDTKGSEFSTLTFVIFVSFVVNSPPH